MSRSSARRHKGRIQALLWEKSKNYKPIKTKAIIAYKYKCSCGHIQEFEPDGKITEIRCSPCGQPLIMKK